MTTINLVIFGIGNVGATLIDQLNQSKSKIAKEQDLHINIAVLANSQKALFGGLKNTGDTWKAQFETNARPYRMEDIVDFLHQQELKNVVAVDATASRTLVSNYLYLIEHGCHVVAANKIANTLDSNFYNTLRKTLAEKNKVFLYETNVGAGLPVVETVKNLYESGESITKIKGVFSGSLSYVFSRYSRESLPFSKILNDALNLGYTEPDAREDLSGNDVARKLLILAREIGLTAEISNISVQSLVPPTLNGKTTLKEFKSRVHELDSVFEEKKAKLSNGAVLCYIGELDVAERTIKVTLQRESLESDFAQLKGTDALFEIYTESYKSRPLIVKGAGAGKEVTARGVLTDILKIGKQLKSKDIAYQY
jgi:aspartokinase/homoserine dehydrogenase 1